MHRLETNGKGQLANKDFAGKCPFNQHMHVSESETRENVTPLPRR